MLAALAAFGLAFGLLWPSNEQSRDPEPGAPAGVVSGAREPLPALEGPTLEPPPPTIALRDLRGAPAFVNVWASWCPSCREEAPMIARLSREFAGRVQFLGIDVEDVRDDARAFIRRYGLRFPHLFDPQAEIARELGVFGVPTAFLVDRDARIVTILIGRQPEEESVAASRGWRAAKAISPGRNEPSSRSRSARSGVLLRLRGYLSARCSA